MSAAENKKLVQQVAENIKKIRLEKNLMQAEVAKKSGLNANFYAKVERGTSKPSVVTLIKLVKGLGIKYSDILP